MTDTSTTEKAQSAASTAADEGKHVAGVAQEEAKKVAGEAATQVRSIVGDARSQVSDQVSEQTRTQRDNIVSTLGTFGDDLHRMADDADGDSLAASVAREVAGHAQSLTGYLDGREPGELLGDVRDFARRRPVVFLVGALAAGVVAGRLARGVKDADPSPAQAVQQTTPSSDAVDQSSYLQPGYPDSDLDGAVPPPYSGPGTIPPPPAYPPSGSGLGTDAAGYGRGQELPGSPA